MNLTHFCAFSLVLTIGVAVNAQSCTKEISEKISKCYQHLVGMSEAIAKKQPEINFISFPLFHFNVHDLRQICTHFQTAESNCINKDRSIQFCPNHPMHHIMSSVFGFACGRANVDLFFDKYQCLFEVTRDNPECSEGLKVPKTPVPGWHKCKTVPQYYNCIKPLADAKCGNDSIDLLDKVLQNFGCTNFNVVPSTAPSTVATQSAASTASGSTKTSGSTRRLSPRPTSAVPSAQTTIAQRKAAAAGCTEEFKKSKGACFAPVNEIWDKYNAKIAEDIEGNATFPIFIFKKAELLDFCDNFASSFLSCQSDIFGKCRGDPKVRLTDTLLGYTCGNLAAFSKAFTCLEAIESQRKQCLGEIDFRVESGTCSGKDRFVACTRVLTERNPACQSNNAAGIIKEAVEYAGCF